MLFFFFFLSSSNGGGGGGGSCFSYVRFLKFARSALFKVCMQCAFFSSSSFLGCVWGGVSGGVGRELLFLCLLFKVCAPHHCRVFVFDVLQLNTQIRQGTGLHYSNSYHLSM